MSVEWRGFRCPNCGGDEFHAWYYETATQTCTLSRLPNGDFEVEYTGVMVGDSEGGANERYVCATEGCDWSIELGEFVFQPLPAPVLGEVDEAFCRMCGCTEDSACDGGCYWVEDPEGGDLCSRCQTELDAAAVLAALDEPEGGADVGNPDPDEKPEGPRDHVADGPEAGHEARA